MKTHLHDSDVPAIEGAKLLAICGAIVPDAKFVFMWDGDNITNQEELAEAMAASVYMCRKCAKTDKQLDRYIYGICDGGSTRLGERFVRK